MADTKISAMTAATAATASTVPVVQGGVNKRVAMTGAGAAMIEAANAAAQAALLTTLMPKAGSAFTGLTGAGFRDTSAAFDVTLGFTSSVALDAGRALTIDVGNVAHTIALGTTAGTITFPNIAAMTVAGLEVANVFTAAQTISVNGAASTPAFRGSGTIFSGGTSETTKPYWLIEPPGTMSTGWSTAGTLFGGNAPSGFTGNIFDFQLDGVSKLKFEGLNLQFGGDFALKQSSSVYLGLAGNNFYVAYSNLVLWNIDNGGDMGLVGQLGFSSTNQSVGTKDCAIKRLSAGVIGITDGSSGYGTLDARAFKVGGVDGVDFSGSITNLTIVKGIVTAAS